MHTRLVVGWAAEKDSEGNKVMIHHPYEVWMRKTFSSQEPWIKVRIIRNESVEGNIVSDSPPPLYHGQLPLKAAKVKDLKKIAAHHIPQDLRGFYTCLRAEGEDDQDTEFTDSDSSLSS